jgi:hypothetical protein
MGRLAKSEAQRVAVCVRPSSARWVQSIRENGAPALTRGTTTTKGLGTRRLGCLSRSTLLVRVEDVVLALHSDVA